MATPQEKKIARIQKEIARMEAELAAVTSDYEVINSELEKLLTVETRQAAEESLYSFYSQSWSVFETVPFIGNWHLECICEHLEAVQRGEILNVIFMVPPRHSKSSIINIAFPIWSWLQNPETKFITAAHGESLAVRDSVKSRQLIESPWFQRNWGDKVKLKVGSNQKTKYENTDNGYRIATSIGGRAVGEGFDCQTPYTKILTNKGPIPIKTLYEEKDESIEVFCYDVDKGLIKRIKPFQYLRNTLRDRKIVRLTFEDGSHTDCTADHQWYTAEFGYIKAEDLISWENRSQLLCLPEESFEKTKRFTEIPEYNLQPRVQSNKTKRISTKESGKALQDLFSRNSINSINSKQSSFLFKQLPKGIQQEPNTNKNLPFLPSTISTQNKHILQQKVFEPSSLSKYEGAEQFELQRGRLGYKEEESGKKKIQEFYQEPAKQDSAKRQLLLSRMWENRTRRRQGFSSSPLKSEENRQQRRESYNSLSILSWESTPSGVQQIYKKVQKVEVLNSKDFSSSYHVYTLSMPPYGNYFVVPEGSNNPVLAKNCLIVDDPHKPVEINSRAALNTVTEWWTGTMPSRANSPTSRRVVMHQRLAECVDGEATILLRDLSTKPLKDIEIGDYVQSSEGFSLVTNKAKKENKKRKIYSIYKWGQTQPIKVTEEHPIFVKSKGFVEAKDLTTNDLVCCPSLLYEVKTELPNLNLVETPSPRKRNPSRIKKSRVCKEDVEYILANNKNKTTQEKAELLGFKNRSALQDVVALYGLEKYLSKYNEINFENYIYNPEFWRFVGWWVAEGSCTQNVVHLAFHQKEVEYHQAIKKLFKKDFPVDIKFDENTNCARVTFSCNNLGMWLKREFGERAEAKKLPEWFLDLPKTYQLSFIRGFYEGDGSYNQNYYRFSSVSKTLLLGIKYCLQTHNIKGLLYRCNTTHLPCWELRVDTNQPWLDFKPVQTTDHKREKSWTYYQKIRKIEINEEEIDVYDITTTSGDFVAEGFLVHNCDLIGTILETDEAMWEVIRLPMEYEPTTFVSSIGWSDPRTQEGEILWPERFPPFEVTRLKKELGSYGFAAQYQQRPAAKEGGIIKRDWINYYPTPFNSYLLKDFSLIIQSWDLSFSNTGDYTVGQVWGKRGPHKYLLDEVRGKWTFTEQLREIRNLKAKWPQTRIILVENAANGAAAIDSLRREIPGLIAINPKEIGGGDKETRVAACSLDFEAGNIYIPSLQIAEWVKDYVQELTTFPKAKYDDSADATAMALNWFASKAGNNIGLMASQDDLKDLNRIIPSKYTNQSSSSYKKEADFSSASRSIINQSSVKDLRNIF
jgi:predicted phage terminase large subunit-like protein